ncbi:MAG: gamma-glutamylcyclotransferase [Myxococcota bacterium]
MRTNELWVFGYGSLIWNPDFPYHRRVPGTLAGFARRFWQESPDHRGTPEQPGRVVTLIREPTSTCFGLLYEVTPQHVPAVLDRLDHRERGGYRRLQVVVTSEIGEISALVYLATEDNPHFAGPASNTELVSQISAARGESGDNIDYVLELDAALARYGVIEPSLRALADRLRPTSAGETTS